MWVVARHYNGGNLLFFDGHVELAKGDRARTIPGFTGTYTDNMIRYWEPDYDIVNPGW